MKAIRFLTATALTGVALTATSTLAQTAPTGVAAPAQVNCAANPTDAGCQATNPDGSVSDSGVITVTGSRIRSPNLESVSPISVVTGEALFETGKVSIGDTLNELPQLRNTFNQQNGTRFLGTRGLNLLDLRGLGTQRTLVLVNGRRHVAADILNNAVSPDINTFPTDLIERIDVVSGGKSAIYGSDAVAGVVNFILKDNFDGVQVRGQAGISNYKDAGAQYGSVLLGQNFADGRGNIAINLEFSHQERYYASDRPNLRQNDAFVVVDTDVGTPSDDVFDRAFFRDIRSSTISLGGQVGIASPRTAQRCGTDPLGNPYTCGFLFQPNGTLIAQTGLRVGLSPNGSYINGNGYSGREGQLITLSPDLKRYSANLIGHFEVSPAFVPFIEAKYVKTVAFGSQSGPFFNQGTGSVENSAATLGFNRERPRLDNPYLSTQARTLLTQQFLLGGVDPNSTSTTPAALTAAQITSINDGSFRFALRRNYVDLGIRDENLRRETYRGVVGVRGSFWDDWSYEVSANYGEFKERNVIAGNISRQRFLLAIDTTTNAAGQIVCRSQVTPSAAGIDRAGNPAQLAADVAACQPLNPFGVGNISQAAKNYLTVTSRAEGKITQFVGSAFVAGDLSSLFELPGGPIGFSIGGEYRRETNYYDLDDYTQAGYAFYNAIPTLAPPAFEVKEAYGEIRVPLLKDIPAISELTLTGSGRVADYKGSTGTVYAYSGGIEYSPVRDLRFRGSYSRSVRAPNLSELYSQQSQNFAPAPNDPCSARNINTGSATRAANCAAAGRPAGYDFVYTSSLEIISGGNPGLQAEKSDSYTGGFVFTPSFVPGLSISADYYDITVNNVITTTGSAQQILNLCYDSPTLNNPFCGLFQRAGAAGGPRGEQAFRVLEGSLLQSTANFAKLKVKGVDTNVAYRHQFDFGTFSINAVWTRAIQNDTFTNPADLTFRDRLLGELNDPKNRVNISTSLKVGKVTLGYQFRFIDKMYLNTYEDYNGLNGLPPQNPDYAPIVQYPTVTYHDVRLNTEINDRFDIYLGVDNAFNKLPPYGLTGVGAGSGIYDNKGRYGYVGVKAKF